MKRPVGIRRIVFGVGVLGLLIGCNAILGDSADQCSTNSDCERRGFTGYTCSAGICVGPSGGDAGQNPDTAPPPEAAQGGCTSHQQCTNDNGGRPALCPTPGAACLPVANDHCEVTGAYTDPNATFIGAVTQINDGFNNPARVMLKNQMLMAHNEISAGIPGGIPGGANGGRRPIVLVSCEIGGTNNTPEGLFDSAKRDANHLLALGVAAITVQSDVSAVAVHDAVTTANKSVLQFHLTPSMNTRTQFAGVGDNTTAFQSVAAMSDLVPAQVAKFPEIETKIRAKPGFPGGDIKVATLVEIGEPGGAFIDAEQKLAAAIQFNGKSVAANGNKYAVVKWDRTHGEDFGKIAQELIAFGPHVIILEAQSVQKTVMPAVEAGWTQSYRPEYLGNTVHAQTATLELVASNDSLRDRIVGAAAFIVPNNPAGFSAWAKSYAEAFPGLSAFTSFGYDFYYGLVYAMVAAGPPTNGKVNGADIVRGLSRIKGGPQKFDVGPANLSTAIAAAVSGPIDVSGYSITLDFDFKTGQPPLTRINMYCVAAGPALKSGLQYYDVATQTLMGNIGCP